MVRALNYTLIPGDWVQLEQVINDLASHIVEETDLLPEYVLVDGTRAMTGQYFYLKGDATTNGSVRFNTSSGETRLEIRIAGSWKGTTWP